MLVLTRKLGEQIEITGGIVLTIVRIDPDSVRIGIAAPASVNIRRMELPKIYRDSPQLPVAIHPFEDCEGT